jgi:hypothetical protein
MSKNSRKTIITRLTYLVFFFVLVRVEQVRSPAPAEEEPEMRIGEGSHTCPNRDNITERKRSQLSKTFRSPMVFNVFRDILCCCCQSSEQDDDHQAYDERMHLIIPETMEATGQYVSVSMGSTRFWAIVNSWCLLQYGRDSIEPTQIKGTAY